MVTVATGLASLYPVNTKGNVEMKGFINGNYGSYNRHWFKAKDGDEKPGHGVIKATGALGEDSVDLWGQHALNGYGVTGWDRTQLTTIATAHAANDLVPTFPFAENPGMIFQGQVADTAGNWDAPKPIEAGAAGVFETGDAAVKIYALSVYYIADTAAAAQLLVMQVAAGGQGG